EPLDLRGRLGSTKEAEEADSQLPLLFTADALQAAEPPTNPPDDYAADAVVAAAPGKGGSEVGSDGLGKDQLNALPLLLERRAPDEPTTRWRNNGVAPSFFSQRHGPPRTERHKGRSIAYLAAILTIVVPLVWLVVEFVVFR
ncbi:MAG TPA: hypothetical protein VMX97_17975, partial [Hyphomicrobiaceae bacterium]|nr:hypothetical protein [Hyphomicrobiaceae bacterium]